MDTPDTHPAPTPGQPDPRRPRRWPRRLAIGVVAAAIVAGGALWYLGRETTLQMIAQRVANATDGKLSITGITGSIYGAMHIERLVWRTDEQVITVASIDLDWSPSQVLSGGILVDSLRAASVRMQTLKDTDTPSVLPASLAPPFRIEVDDARLQRLTMVNLEGAETAIDNIRLRARGDKRSWAVRDASAGTPWGQVAANATVGAQRPFKIDASGSLTQSQASAGARAAQLRLKVGGDLENATRIDATGQAGRATGDAHLTISPYAEIPLRALRINGRNLDPGFFSPALPTADLTFALAGKLDANRNVSGSVDITNTGPRGTLDQQRLPLRGLRGQLGGNLDALQVSDVLLDFGAAGKFIGTGDVRREPGQESLGTARFVLQTERFNLREVYSAMKPTAIKGSIALSNEVMGTGAATRQRLEANLADAGLRLAALATLENNVATLENARLTAGRGSVTASGSMNLEGDKAFKATASASRFDPSAFGDLPAADINATVNAAGALAPQWKVDADFAVRQSRLLNQALSGRGKLSADATRISGVDAELALGQNKATLSGAFGGPGDRLAWRLDGRQLAAVRSDLYGALTAHGVVSGTMAAPRTTFDIDARDLGWVAAQRKNGSGVLRASGQAWLGGPEGARAVEFKASGSTQKINPAAFGSPLAASINAGFSVSGSAGADWRGALELKVDDDSRLANSPLRGHARLNANRRRVSNADVDLRIGPNIIAANGAFGLARDRLEWKIDAPQLAALGPEYGGALRGAGELSGTMHTPSLVANVEARDLKVPGGHNIRSLRAGANLGSGRGAADPLVSNVEVLDYVSGETRVASARLQTEGTRGAHTVKLAALGDGFDANAEIRGGLNRDTWSGTLAALQNRGRYAMRLQQAVPVTIAGAPGSGPAGLASPQRLSFNGAVIALPSGSITIDTLVKNGPRWSSEGHADKVPLTYLAQFSPALAQNARGDLTLGAVWAVDMRAPRAKGAAPSLDGSVRVYRESGDAIVGGDSPVPLGLRQLQASAEVVGSSLRVNLDFDGTRTGVAKLEADAQMLNGRLERDSPLRMTANADIPSIAWLASLAGQPGLELDGALRLAMSGTGTVGNPILNGNLDGDKLAVRWAEQGVRLHNGQLRARLDGDQLLLQRLSFQGRQGSVAASGFLRLADGAPAMDVRLTMDKLEALSRPDRTLIMSGQASLVRDASRFALEGKFRADRALIEFAPQDRPTISDDVIVLGRGVDKKTPSASEKDVTLLVDLAADLGDDFHVRAMGIDAYLAGNARVRMTGSGLPRINGTIRAVSGTYAAYGQNLTIERAVLTFSGPYDNPSLDILAVRKRPEGEQLSETNVEAGVQVRGTAQAPIARLVSTPNVSDSDKLSWLVLGHGMESASGDQKGVLTAAAAALLGGSGGTGGIQSRLANSLGVDELALKPGSGGDSSGLESTVVTIGKRISSRAYLSFEQGTSTASSVVRLRYRLTPRIALQFQTGTNSALDVLYSWAFD